MRRTLKIFVILAGKPAGARPHAAFSNRRRWCGALRLLAARLRRLAPRNLSQPAFEYCL